MRITAALIGISFVAGMPLGLQAAAQECKPGGVASTSASVILKNSPIPDDYPPVKWGSRLASKKLAKIEATERLLAQTILSKVDFRDTPLSEALSFLQHKTGIPMVAIMMTTSSQEPQPLTLCLEKTSAAETLRYITALSGLKQSVEPGAVLLTPYIACNMPSMTSMEIPLAGRVDNKIAGEKSLKEVLTKNGVSFPPGSSLSYDNFGTHVTVHNTEANLDQIAEIWPALSDVFPGPTQEAPTQIHHSLHLQRLEAWEKALSETTVIHAEIHNASMEEIAAVLRSKITPRVGIQVAPDTRVTLSANSGSLLELLQKIAAESHTRLILGLAKRCFRLRRYG